MSQPSTVVRSVLADFPPVQHAFAYGSGVFNQPGLYTDSVQGTAGTSGSNGGSSRGGALRRPMLDFIFAVEDPVAWHAENLLHHPQHYSMLKLLGPDLMTAVAEQLGAGLYFNTLVPWRPGQLIKYGIIRLEALQQDLLHWTSLYCAGRMHKPVATLAEHPAVAAAQRVNLASALTVALLLLPAHFTTQDLLQTICAISYSGDVRMGLAEDRSKVQRIVAGSEAGLRQLLAEPIHAAQQRWRVLQPAAQRGKDAWVQDHSPAAVAQLTAALPAGVLRQLGAPSWEATPPATMLQGGEDTHCRQYQQIASQGSWARNMAALPALDRQRLLRGAIHRIVHVSSRRQAIAGLLTAGVLKSVHYGWAKVLKAWK